ncbi:hypothetical protein SDC9_171063 [bioreactor metagenome]|uniref:Uncharacterized protein n=1 Tax=bioreactor metagenome TaxID=1076179 RepID=A0A645GC66_9ZZZZ
MRKVAVEEQRAVADHASVRNVLSVAGDLEPFNEDVVAATQFSIHTQFFEAADDRLSEQLEVFKVSRLIIGHKAEVQIAQVMIDRATAREAAHYADVMLIHIVFVDLFNGVLVAANDDRRSIDIKQDHIIRQVGTTDHILFEGQVNAGIVLVQVIDKIHSGFLIHSTRDILLRLILIKLYQIAPNQFLSI